MVYYNKKGKGGIMMNSLISTDNTWALWAILVGITAISIYLEQTYKWAAKLLEQLLVCYLQCS